MEMKRATAYVLSIVCMTSLENICCVYCKGNAVDDKIRFLSKESLRSDNFMLLIRPTKCILKRLFAVDLCKNVIVYQHNAKPRESHPDVSSSNITCQIAMPCHLHWTPILRPHSPIRTNQSRFGEPKHVSNPWYVQLTWFALICGICAIMIGLRKALTCNFAFKLKLFLPWIKLVEKILKRFHEIL